MLRSENNGSGENDRPLSVSTTEFTNMNGESPDEWIHIVSYDSEFVVTFDITLCNKETDSISTDLVESSGNEYILNFVSDSVSDTSCDTGTRVRGGSTLPNDFDRIHIDINEERIMSIEQRESLPNLHEIPNRRSDSEEQ
ncbi:hypothetical protein [Natrialba magadii]|uniref:hypothetical protein n=1 Tax=Natrialba magadii TaxID=13769 RepID=UPI00146169D5|nr:hypothetical protein [Natrialba magadii]